MDALLHVSEDRDSDGAAAWHFAGGDCDVCPSPVMLVFGRLISSGGRYLNTNVQIELIMMMARSADRWCCGVAGRWADRPTKMQCRDRASERAKDTVCNNIHVDLQTSLKGRLERKGYSRSTVLGKSFTHHTATPPLARLYLPSPRTEAASKTFSSDSFGPNT